MRDHRIFGDESPASFVPEATRVIHDMMVTVIALAADGGAGRDRAEGRES